MAVRIVKYTFPNGARLYTDRASGGRGLGARYGPPWMPLSQSVNITRSQAATALRDARRQKLDLHPLRWVAGQTLRDPSL
jgi:hypothetical protein